MILLLILGVGLLGVSITALLRALTTNRLKATERLSAIEARMSGVASPHKGGFFRR